jgi:hypothetical protein
LGGFRAVCANNERMGQAYDETRRSRTGAGPRVQCPLPRRDNFCSYRFSARTNVARQCFDMKISTHGSRSERAHSVKPPFEIFDHSFWKRLGMILTWDVISRCKCYHQAQLMSDICIATLTFWQLHFGCYNRSSLVIEVALGDRSAASFLVWSLAFVSGNEIECRQVCSIHPWKTFVGGNFCHLSFRFFSAVSFGI